MKKKSKELTVAQTQELFDMLIGESLPEEIFIADENKPKLSPRQAQSVLWFLQEHLYLIPDHYEVCAYCNSIYDSYEDGIRLGDEPPEDDYLDEHEITIDIYNEYIGITLCDICCEINFWNRAKWTKKSH